MITVSPVILCGGSGTRLWPLSRAGFPKQFLCLGGDASLFQQAVRRLLGLQSAQIGCTPPLVVTNEEHRFLVVEQLRETGATRASLLLEPEGRNTAAALTLAALAARSDGADPVLVVTPSDHAVADETAFSAALSTAVEHAQQGAIATLGVRPDRPETGYGYIKSQPGIVGAAPVERFVEKPDAATAACYLAEGSYFWNAGIFVLKASVWLDALGEFRPDILAACNEAWLGRSTDASFIRPARQAFAAVPSESIDYAVMEPCAHSRFSLVVVPLEAGWNDLGAWDAVWETLPKDAEGNALVGDVIAVDSRNTLVHAGSRLVGVVGMSDVVVVETPDAVLVADLAGSQQVKQVVARLTEGRRDERSLHRKVHRPWGWYDCIDGGERFKVKRILVKPGASFSLQKHHHRAEHWIVVRGTAEITHGKTVTLLSENQSTYIPIGAVHRLANPGTIELEIIEVQSGSYLGEDDIVRFDDNYGRTNR